MVAGLFLGSDPKVAGFTFQMLWRRGESFNPSNSRDLPVMGEAASGCRFEKTCECSLRANLRLETTFAGGCEKWIVRNLAFCQSTAVADTDRASTCRLKNLRSEVFSEIALKLHAVGSGLQRGEPF